MSIEADFGRLPPELEAFPPREYEITWKDLEVYGPEALFVITGAEKWIAQHRLPRMGRLDIEATAANVGIPVTYTEDIPYAGKIEGLPRYDGVQKPLLISLRSSEYAMQDVEVTFGHELGHAFSQLVLNNRTVDRDVNEEEFCDVFGVHMALSPGDLDSSTTVDEEHLVFLCLNRGIKMYQLIEHCMKQGLLPDRVKVKSIHDDGENKGKVNDGLACLACLQDRSCSNQTPEFELVFNETIPTVSFSTCKNDERYIKFKKEWDLAHPPQQYDFDTEEPF